MRRNAAGLPPLVPMRRPSRSLVLSLSIHAALGVLVLRAVLGSAAWLAIPRAESKPAQETVRYVGIQGRVAPVAVEGREGGDGVPERRNAKPAPLPPPPSVVPSAVPPPPVASVPTEPPAGRGPLVGRGGALRGIEPAYTDERVWSELVPAPYVPLTQKQRVDSVIAERFRDYQDSLRVAQAARGRDGSDWTVEKGGYKWGLDRSFIRLGPLSIPTALLGLLPMNNASMQGNVFASERMRRQDAWSREINEQAQRSLNEDEFRVAVKRLRERKEKERLQKKAERETIATPGGSE